MKNGKDMFVLGICMVLLFLFVFFLPQLTNEVRNSAKNQEIEEEKIPITYYCERDVDNQYNADVLQKATYTIKDKEVTYAHIIRTYKFSTIEDYNSYKDSIIIEEVVGEEVNYTYDQDNLVVTETIDRDINKIDSSDLDSNFPKTYDNLLIYTKGQTCQATY